MHPEQLQLPITEPPPAPEPERHEVLLVQQKRSKPMIDFEPKDLSKIQVVSERQD